MNANPRENMVVPKTYPQRAKRQGGNPLACCRTRGNIASVGRSISYPANILSVSRAKRADFSRKTAMIDVLSTRPKRAGILAWVVAIWMSPTLQVWSQADRPAAVEVERVRTEEVAAGQEFVGTIVPIRTAVIGSAVDGRVIEFPINEGDRVEANQPLAQLLTETIGLELQAAAAQLLLRQQELDELERSHPAEVEQARARREAARAAQEYLTARRERTETLFRERRIASEEDLQEAVSASLRADELLHEADAAYTLVTETYPDKKAQAESQVAIQTAIVEKLRDQVQKHTIISRFAGYVTAEHTEVGQWVKQGEPVAEIAALDEVDVEAHVLESHIRFVRVGTSARVEVPALAQPAWTGAVVSVVPQADERSRTFRVKVRLKNEIEDDEPLLKAGMLARVTLPTGAKQQAMLVSKDALVLGNQAPIVWVAAAKNVQQQTMEPGGIQVNKAAVEPVLVRLGVAVGTSIQLIDDVSPNDYPIQPGDFIVVRGNERIFPTQPGRPPEVIWPVAPTPSAAP
jgi:RND family efflux transporter MFP subunit